MTEECQDERPEQPGGGITIGFLGGGAVAQGEGAVAEDDSRQAGPAAALPPSVPALPGRAAGPGETLIGAMTGGAVASGRRVRAVNRSVRLGGEAGAQFLTALRGLRRDVADAEPQQGDGLDELAAELDALEGEIVRTGQVGGQRLARLRERLGLTAAGAGVLASAAAVAQTIDTLLS